jgi:hypothetical protein
MLSDIQQRLKAPKNQRNTFGNYNYRSCEDILEAVKPLLGRAVLTLTDEVLAVGSRIYVKATASLTEGDKTTQVSAYAREAESQKGMSDPQLTGSASSYARKYALNGLFCIDDTKDDDVTNTHEKETPAKPPKQTKLADKEIVTQALKNPSAIPPLNEKQIAVRDAALASLQEFGDNLNPDDVTRAIIALSSQKAVPTQTEAVPKIIEKLKPYVYMMTVPF